MAHSLTGSMACVLSKELATQGRRWSPVSQASAPDAPSTQPELQLQGLNHLQLVSVGHWKTQSAGNGPRKAGRCSPGPHMAQSGGGTDSSPRDGMASSFCRGPSGKQFGLGRPCGLCHSSSILLQ